MRALRSLLLFVWGGAAVPSIAWGASPSHGYRGGVVTDLDTVGVLMESALGPNGGTHLFQVQAASSIEEWRLLAAMPVASLRTYRGRAVALGNLLVHIQRRVGFADQEGAAGLAVHLNPGGDAYTWVQKTDQLWPGSGLEGTWDAHHRRGDRVWMWGARAGVHTSAGYEPVPATFVRLMMQGGMEQKLSDSWSFVGEVSVSYWDLAPLLAATFVAWEPVEGLRAQGGLVHPVATWIGWTPAQATRGFQETTAVFEVTFAQ